MISMKTYRIITDGSCDMPASLAEEKRVTVVPFYVTMDEKTYIKENVDISKTDFYKWMVENKGCYPKSSTPSVQDYLDVFTEAAEAGEDVICICITRKFSTSFESAQMAADMLAETHPGCRVTVINAMVNTVLQALLVLEAVKLRDKGVDYDECVRRVKAARPSGRIFFTVGSIDYLRHGGRIGKLAGIAGTILGIRPLITLKEGEIFPAGITRSRQKSIEKVEALALDYETAEQFGHQNGHNHAQHVESCQYEGSMAVEECRDKYDIGGDAGGTTHHGDDQHGEESAFPVFDGAGSHNGGNIASESHYHGDETFTM